MLIKTNKSPCFSGAYILMEDKEESNLNKLITKCQKVINLWNATEQGQEGAEGREEAV